MNQSRHHGFSRIVRSKKDVDFFSFYNTVRYGAEVFDRYFFESHGLINIKGFVSVNTTQSSEMYLLTIRCGRLMEASRHYEHLFVTTLLLDAVGASP